MAFNNDAILIKLANYVRRMNDSFYELLEDKERLKDLEAFLNEMGIECRLVLKKLPDGQRELYFEHEKLVPFSETASSGTLALVDLYRRLIPRGWEPSFILEKMYNEIWIYGTNIYQLYDDIENKMELGLQQSHLQLFVKYYDHLKIHKPDPRIVCGISKQRNYKQT